MSDFVQTFRSAMNASGLVYSGEIVGDGKLRRFNCDGETGEASWYVLHVADRFSAAGFGCWRKNIKQTWNSSNGSTLSDEDKRMMRDKIRESESQRKTVEEQMRSNAKAKAGKMLSAAEAACEHDYLARKKVAAHGEIRTSGDGLLLLPLRDISGALQSLQLIAPDNRWDGRDKHFLAGGLTMGCFYAVSDRESGPLVICEGYATGASVFEATGYATFCAMFAGNLSAVGTVCRKKWPNRVIIFAADNDRFTADNPGLTKATEAAKVVRGFVAAPGFADNETKSTDFNDLARLSGLDAVRLAITDSTRGSGDWSLLLVDAAEAISKKIEDPVQIVEGLITECCKCVIGGGSKTYKTWMTMNLAVALTTRSGRFLGRACLPRRTLYVNLELRESTFNRRLQHITKAIGCKLEPGVLKELHLRGHLTQTTVKQAIDRIIAAATSFEAAVVILDPIYKLNLEGDENSSRDQTLLFNQLDRITTEAGCSLILNDHFSKGNQSEKDPLDAIRGSSAKGGDVDAAIVLRAHETKGSFRVDVIHRELPPVEPFVITWNFPLFESDTSLSAEDMKRAKGGKPSDFNYAAAMTSLCIHGKPVNLTEWANIAGVDRKTLSRHTPEMRSNGWIETVGDGSSARQQPTEKGRTLYGVRAHTASA
jgi:phage/plasmid primase-like uncharacterized protein/DNA-binding MarR family transcriptional regulator